MMTRAACFRPLLLSESGYEGFKFKSTTNTSLNVALEMEDLNTKQCKTGSGGFKYKTMQNRM